MNFKDFFKGNPKSETPEWVGMEPQDLKREFPWTHVVKMSVDRKRANVTNSAIANSNRALMGPRGDRWDKYPRDPYATNVAELMLRDNGFIRKHSDTASYVTQDSLLVDGGAVETVYQRRETRGDTVSQFSLLMFKSMPDSAAIVRLLVSTGRPDITMASKSFNPYTWKPETIFERRSPLNGDLLYTTQDGGQEHDSRHNFTSIQRMIQTALKFENDRKSKARVTRRGGQLDI